MSEPEAGNTLDINYAADPTRAEPYSYFSYGFLPAQSSTLAEA